MGFLNNNEISIDVVYTKLGRKYKSEGSNLAIPKKYSLTDVGVDYNLYDASADEGLKGLKIERTPLLSANTSNSNVMGSRLISVPRATVDRISSMIVSPQILSYQTDNTVVMIKTISTTLGTSSSKGVRFILDDSTYFYLDRPPISTRSSGYYESEDITLNNVKKSQYVEKRGSGTSNNEHFTVDVVFSPTRRKFTLDKPYVTKVTILDLESGFTKKVDVELINITAGGR